MDWVVILFLIIYLFILDEKSLTSSMSAEEIEGLKMIKKQDNERADFLNKRSKERFEKERYENHKRKIEAFEKISITSKL